MTIDDVAKAVADALDRAGVEFTLTGALASAYYGLCWRRGAGRCSPIAEAKSLAT